ncbi:MAG: hypothetical protein NXI24_10555 [bacterium]|nr:hypothetical protein [bacterium]
MPDMNWEPQGVSEIVEIAYQVFESYELVPGLAERASPIRDYASELEGVPLRTVDADLIRTYSWHAVTTVGGVEDFKHFMPRILEVQAADLKERAWIHAGMVTKLKYADWKTWPEVEIRTLTMFQQSLWLDLLSEFHAFTPAFDFLQELEKIFTSVELEWFLDVWDELDAETALRHRIYSLHNKEQQERFPRRESALKFWALLPRCNARLEPLFFSLEDRTLANEISEELWSHNLGFYKSEQPFGPEYYITPEQDQEIPRALIDRLYAAAPEALRPGFEERVFPFGDRLESAWRLMRFARRELPLADAAYFAHRGLRTMGDAEDFLYFLPRLLECMAFEDWPCHGDQIVPGKIRECRSHMPDDFWNATLEFCLILWQRRLDRFDYYHCDAIQYLDEMAAAFDGPELRSFFEAWLARKDRAAHLHLAAAVYRAGYWNRSDDTDPVGEWFREGTVKEALLRFQSGLAEPALQNKIAAAIKILS